MPLKRRGLLWIAIAVLLLAAAVWAARDLPRRMLEDYLAETLEARVEIERLRFEGWRKLRLVGVRAGAFANLPAIEEVTFDELVAEGRAREVLAGRLERLTARGMSARLVPGAVRFDRDSTFRIAELELEPGVLRVTAGDPSIATTLAVAGSFREIGGETSGVLELQAPEVELVPLFDLAREAVPVSIPAGLGGRLAEVDGTVELAPGSLDADLRAADGRLLFGERTLTVADLGAGWSSAAGRHELRAQAGGAVAAVGEGTADLGAVRVLATAEPAADRPGVFRVEIDPELEIVREARLAADWDRERRRLLTVDGRVAGVDLALLTALAGPRQAGVRGELDVDFVTEDSELAYTVSVRPRAIELGARRVIAARASIEVAGRLPFEPLAAGNVDGLSGPLAITLDLPAARVELDRSRPVPAELFPARASFRGELVDAGWHGGDPQATFRGAYALATAAAGRLGADGELRWKASALTADLGWRWRGGDLAHLAEALERSGRLDAAGLAIEGRVAADGRLAGDVADPLVAGEVRVDGLSIRRAEASWRLVDGAVEAELRRPPRPARTEVRIRRASADLELPSLILPLSAEGRLFAAPSFRSGLVDDFALTSAGLGELRFDGGFEVSGGSSPVFDGELQVREVDVAAWQDRLGVETESVRFRGRLHADLEARYEAAGEWRLDGPASLLAAGASSADGSRAVEGLEIVGSVAASGGGSSPTEFRARGTSGGFAALWGIFFEDFAELTGSVELEAAAPRGGSAADLDWRLAARLDVPPGGVVAGEMRPSERPGSIDYELRLEAPDLAAVHDRYLRKILEERFERPELAGRMRADLHGTLLPADDGAVRPDGIPWLAGDVYLEAFHGSIGDQLAVEDLALHLPVDLRGGREEPGGERRPGRLGFERLSFRGLELPRTRSAIWSQGDDLEIEDPLHFHILGGTVTLDRLSVRDLLAADPYLASSLSFADLSLERIAETLDLFPLTGTVAGSFPRFRLSARELRAEGGGEIEVFGGRVSISDISGKNVLSSFPTLTLSASFEDVDLGRLTRRLDFGEMTGILKGSVSDCEFFRGVPVRCAARFETVHRPGVPRTVDVKAINNLSILGTGERVGPLDRGLHRFLDRYRYQRLGIELRLDADRLLLRGLERRRGRELFLRGRWPFPIDVVNVLPGRTVSFKTLLQRLRAIDFSAAGSRPAPQAVD